MARHMQQLQLSNSAHQPFKSHSAKSAALHSNSSTSPPMLANAPTLLDINEPEIESADSVCDTSTFPLDNGSINQNAEDCIDMRENNEENQRFAHSYISLSLSLSLTPLFSIALSLFTLYRIMFIHLSYYYIMYVYTVHT